MMAGAIPALLDGPVTPIIAALAVTASSPIARIMVAISVFFISLLLTRRSRNQKSYKLSFTLLGSSSTIAQTQNFGAENLNYAKLYRAAQY
jgi:hypothetical protein